MHGDQLITGVRIAVLDQATLGGQDYWHSASLESYGWHRGDQTTL